VAHVAIVGSVALDEVLRVSGSLRVGGHGSATRLGERIGGGAAGVAIPLARLGHRASLVAPIGSDPAGDLLLEELRTAGVDTDPVLRVDGESTRSLILVDDGGERTILNLHRCAEPEPPRRLLSLGADCVYVRSRLPGLAPLLSRALSTARVVAHVPPCGDGERPAHVLVGSESDLPREWLERPFESGLAVAGARLEHVVVTHGAAGASLSGRGGTRHVPAPRVTALDSTGAGDAFAAGLVHGLAGGLEVVRAVEIAAAWGAECARWRQSVLPAEAVPGLPTD
jgi:sugar/nucleoside kinase (ribokinase family)